VTGSAVHVWRIGLDIAASRVPEFLDLLSGEERVKAARLRTTQLRLRYVTAHGALRTILGRYLDAAPASIRFVTSAFGKPSLPDSPLSFNLSHSEGLALCAISAPGQLGVDVERIRPVVDGDSIVSRYFAPAEAAGYAALGERDRLAAFFSTWTRKEAFLKATGLGLQRSLDSFAVEIDPDAMSPTLTISGGATGIADDGFHLRSFVPEAGYAAAVALDRAIDTLELFEWTCDAQPEPLAHRTRVAPTA
jgi:4'-phosphopantetheinyl transferase